MEQKNKDLLLKDLCGRIPYGVKGYVNGKITTLQGVNIMDSIVEYDIYCNADISEFTPYLFPLWRMTKKQKEELDALYWEAREKTCNDYEFKCVYSGLKSDWFDKNHFDYRGLIPMGLAIDATNLNIY